MLKYSIKIKRSDDLTKRAFIEIIIKGKRFKEYTGLKLGVNLKPNYASTISQRDEQLKTLEYEYKKAIDLNIYPVNIKSVEKAKKSFSAFELFQIAISNKKKANLSPKYVLNLESITLKFIAFLNDSELKGNIENIERNRIQEFLNNFGSTASYYMIVRRHLKAIYSEINKFNPFDLSVFNNTDKRKASPILHKPYLDNQLQLVLENIRDLHPDLHLCCLLSYGCLLRPHNEIRLLKKDHFKNNFSEIHLSGSENKSGKIRIVPVPKFVRILVVSRLEKLSNEDNIFSGNLNAFNEFYFNTAWKRIFKKLEPIGLIQNNQTIYSFRHTAAINVYKKTKDLHILQQLLGHSDMIVTLKYLRGLGVHNTEELRSVMPEL